MANDLFKRFLVVSLTVLAAQAFLGDIIIGLFPAVTEFAIGFVSVGGAITVAIGVWVGEMILARMKK